MLLSFGGLPRFFGTVSVIAASVDAEVGIFFGLPRFLVTLSAVTLFAKSAARGGVGATPLSS